MAGRLTHVRVRAKDRDARVSSVVRQHGHTLTRIASAVSLCADDAHDAVQRALEIYLRRVETLDPASDLPWLKVVVRNEALAVRRARAAADAADPDAVIGDWRTQQEFAEGAELVSRADEALSGLKADEARALLLKAEGHSYAEIGARLGWTYTKTNRSLTEGRARFRKLYGRIERGERCVELAPLLAALGEGGASADDLLALRPHLRSCSACRAEVRRLHGSWLRRAAAALWLPLPAAVGRLRAELYGLAARLGGGGGAADPAAAAAAPGGARGLGAAALVALCLGGAGAGGYCLVTGGLPEPLGREQATAAPRRTASVRAAATPARTAVAASVATATRTVAARPAATPVATAAARATSTATPRPRARAPRAATTTFSFEQRAQPSAAAPRAPRAAPTPAPRARPAAAPRSSAAFGFER